MSRDAAVISPLMEKIILTLQGYPDGCKMAVIKAAVNYHPTFEINRLIEAGLVASTGPKGKRVYTYNGAPYQVKGYVKEIDLDQYGGDDLFVKHLADLDLDDKQKNILRTFNGDSRRALAQALGISKTELNHLILTRRVKRDVKYGKPQKGFRVSEDDKGPNTR